LTPLAKTENPVGECHIYIKATSSSKYIGNADFIEDDDTIDIQNINVEPSYRRCGVGTAMCVLASKILRKPPRNIWDISETTKEFLSFWENLKCQLSNQFDYSAPPTRHLRLTASTWAF